MVIILTYLQQQALNTEMLSMHQSMGDTHWHLPPIACQTSSKKVEDRWSGNKASLLR